MSGICIVIVILHKCGPGGTGFGRFWLLYIYFLYTLFYLPCCCFHKQRVLNGPVWSLPAGADRNR